MHTYPKHARGAFKISISKHTQEIGGKMDIEEEDKPDIQKKLNDNPNKE
jgi:hypothetical protein